MIHNSGRITSSWCIFCSWCRQDVLQPVHHLCSLKHFIIYCYKYSLAFTIYMERRNSSYWEHSSNVHRMAITPQRVKAYHGTCKPAATAACSSSHRSLHGGEGSPLSSGYRWAYRRCRGHVWIFPGEHTLSPDSPEASATSDTVKLHNRWSVCWWTWWHESGGKRVLAWRKCPRQGQRTLLGLPDGRGVGMGWKKCAAMPACILLRIL